MKKFLAVLLAMVMTVSLVACGGTQPGNENPTPEPTSEPTKAPDTVTDEISIDFEDGNFGFAMMKTRPRKADESVLSVTEVNGSKALYVKHVEAAEMHLGIDIDAILGEKVTEVRKITMTLGTEHGDAKFASAAGELLVYTGDQLVETKVSTWAVYMKNKNPKTVTIELPEGVAFTAGNDNYFVINKLEDTGSVISDFYIDDIRFYDANGNVLKGDTTVVMEAPANFLKRVEEEDDNTSAVKVAMDEAYGGDWGQSGIISAEVLSQFTSGVTITVKYELQSGYDYYLWGPMDSSWAKLGPAKIGMTAKAAAEEGDKYHVQDDGFIVIDDFTNTEITFTLPAAVVAELVASGGLSAQTYGVTVYEIVLEGKAPTMLKEKVAADEAYGGDWGQSGIVSADVLAKFGGDVTVTVKYELQSGYDYYLWGPMDSSWAKLGPAKIGMTAKAAAEEGDKYHVQDDGFIVIDDFTNTELTFTLPAAVVAELVASGGLSAQTYGVVAYELVLEGVAGGTSAPAVTPDAPAEEPAEPEIDPTNDTIEGTVGYTGTYKMSDSTWWTQVSMTKADILGDVSADQVAGIKFTSDTKFVIGYNADANGTWKQYDSGNTYVVKTIELSDEAFGFCFALSKGDGVEYTITWEVYLKGEEASGDDILAEYAGDYGLGWSASVAELQALTGNVTLTFDVAYTGTVDYPQFTLIDQGDGWSKLKAEDFAANAPTINSYEFIEMFDPSVTSFTTTISADAIARIIANGGGLGVQVNGIVVRNAKLTAAE